MTKTSHDGLALTGHLTAAEIAFLDALRTAASTATVEAMRPFMAELRRLRNLTESPALPAPRRRAPRRSGA